MLNTPPMLAGPPGKVANINPRDVVVGKRLRELNPEKVRELAMSFLQSGQLHPIGVRDDGGSKYTLGFGAHRLAACIWLEEQGNTVSVQAIVFPPECPDGWIKLYEIVENLHRLELTPDERAAHLMAYAGWCKNLGLVETANIKRSVKQAEIETQKVNGTGDSDDRSHRSEPLKPTITEKAKRDFGVTESTVHARHATAVRLAEQGGVKIDGAKGIETMAADKQIEAGEVAMKEASKKKAKPKTNAKPKVSQQELKKRREAVLNGLKPMASLTREQVDPDFKGTGMDFVDKYGHVQLRTKKQMEEDNDKAAFSAWVGAFRDLKKPLSEYLKVGKFSVEQYHHFIAKAPNKERRAGEMKELADLVARTKESIDRLIEPEQHLHGLSLGMTNTLLWALKRGLRGYRQDCDEIVEDTILKSNLEEEAGMLEYLIQMLEPEVKAWRDEFEAKTGIRMYWENHLGAVLQPGPLPDEIKNAPAEPYEESIPEALDGLVAEGQITCDDKGVYRSAEFSKPEAKP
jgi:ParB-like nuclease domain